MHESLGNLEVMVIFTVMRLGKDAYGVPIAKELEELSGREVAVGSIYAALDRLENKGLVSSRMGEPTPERGGRAKRFFRVTPEGVRRTREVRSVLEKLWQGMPELEGGQA